MGNVKKSFVAQSVDGGVVFAGPSGVLPLPTAAATALSPDWKKLDHGTVSENGLSLSYTRTSKKVKDFDGATYLTLQEEFTDGLKAKFYDVDNHNLVQTVYGTDNVEITEATGTHGEQIRIFHSPDDLPFQQIVCTTRSGRKRKLYTGEIAKVSAIAEIVDVYNDVTFNEVTWDVFRDDDGHFLTEYRDDGVFVGASKWTVATTLTGGSFPLKVGSTAVMVAYNASAAAMKTALEALPGVGAGNVNVTGTGPWEVTLTNGGVLSTSDADTTVVVAP